MYRRGRANRLASAHRRERRPIACVVADSRLAANGCGLKWLPRTACGTSLRGGGSPIPRAVATKSCAEHLIDHSVRHQPPSPTAANLPIFGHQKSAAARPVGRPSYGRQMGQNGNVYRDARASASWIPVSLTASSVASTLRMATANWRSGIRTVLASQRGQFPP